jgi:N-acetylglucosamine-6-phosphate deacetylase
MLGLQGVKGTLDAGADADLVIFSDEVNDGSCQLVLDEVWKFGTRVSRLSKAM